MKRVLVVNGENVMVAAVESLLAREKDLCILTTPALLGADDLSEVTNFNPQVIIMEESMLSGALTHLLDLMIELPELLIMVIQLGNNQVQLYEKRMLQVSRGSDLTEAIR